MPVSNQTISARDRIIHHLESSPRDMALLKSRLANVGKDAGYRMTIADICPELASTYHDDVADMVSRALRARPMDMIRRARRAA